MSVVYFMRHPKNIIIGVLKRLGRWIPDKKYLEIYYKLATGQKLHLENPLTYNEKLQWLKLYDRNSLYTIMVDKYAVKEYVASVVGPEYVIPVLGVWDKFEDIDFDLLPDQFVLKATHDSGGIVLCEDKRRFDVIQARDKINAHLKNNLYHTLKEWPYKDVFPRIMAEKYMVDEGGYELKDYKVFVFDGVPKIMHVDYDRFAGHKRNVYTLDWDFIDVCFKFPNNKDYKIERPVALDKMIELSQVLGRGLPHVRVDFYSIKEKVYVGEITFYHGSGTEFFPDEWNYKMGDWIKLPERNDKVF